MSPLHWACDRGLEEMVEVLLRHNADINVTVCSRIIYESFEFSLSNILFSVADSFVVTKFLSVLYVVEKDGVLFLFLTRTAMGRRRCMLVSRL